MGGLSSKQLEGDCGSYPSSHIDTQALLARIDERQKQRGIKRKAESGSLEKSDVDQKGKMAHSEAAGNSLLQCTDTSMGISNVLTKPHTPVPLLKVPRLDTSQTHGAQDGVGIPSSMEEQIPPSGQTTTGGVGSDIPTQPSLSDASNAKQDTQRDRSACSSVAAMMNNPDFARSPEIAQWADLSPDVRHAALETWMCEQLESESFATLLKTMEGTWQRVFFGQ